MHGARALRRCGAQVLVILILSFFFFFSSCTPSMLKARNSLVPHTERLVKKQGAQARHFARHFCHDDCVCDMSRCLS